MKHYEPVTCQFYDQLEELAVKKVRSKITYLEDEKEKMIEANIIDFKTFNKEEFLILDNGLEIRLDMIVQINDILPLKSC